MKAKKLVAIVLTATMVLGSSLTVFAADVVTGTTTGVDGTGTSTGHVDTKLVNIVWPTVPATSPFDFAADPEGLIRKSGKYKAAAATLPNEDVDTRVYFATATSGTWANESTALDVTNKSSIPLTITAKATAKNGAGVTYVDDKESAAGIGDIKLYLGLKVGDEVGAVKDEEVSVSVNVDGYADNYEYDSKSDGSFEYKMVASPDESKWSKTSIALEGAVNAVDDASAFTAPTVEVTWEYKKGNQGTAAVLPYNNDSYLALKGVADADFAKPATSVIVNTKDVTAKAELVGGYVAVSATDLVAAGVDLSEGTLLSVEYVVDGTPYNASLQL